jgi:positive regulator of sigma E activity
MNEYLKQQRVHLVKQKMLLDTVLLWYIFPLFMGILLASLPSEQLWPVEFWSFHVLYPIGLVVFAIILYQLNLKAARAVQPLIDEVDETLQDLEE